MIGGKVFDIGYGLCAVVGLTASCYKLLAFLREPRNYSLLLVALAAAFPSVAFICAAPSVYVRLDRWAGIPNLATLVVYSFIVLFSGTVQVLLLLWVNQPRQARGKIRWRVSVMGLVLATMISLFFLATGDGVEEPLDFDVRYATLPLIAGFLVIYQVTFASSLLGIGRLCRSYASALGYKWNARGLRAVTVGAGFGLGYCLLKLIAIAGRWFGADLDALSTEVAPASASVGALFVAAGFSLPALGARLAVYRSYRRLYPLWYALATAFPEVVLDPPSGAWLERWLPKRLRFRLVRQVIEISDGRLALLQHFDKGAAAAVREQGEAAGLTNRALEAMVEGVMMRQTLDALASGTASPANGEDGPALAGTGPDSLPVETAWLEQVAEAFTRSPPRQDPQIVAVAGGPVDGA